MDRDRRRMLFVALPVLVAGAAFNASGCASAYDVPASWVSGGTAAIEIVDRATGEHLPAWRARGDNFVVGVPGHEYRLRIRNLTGGRILAVGSVDGVNIVSGESAAASQQGYVLGPWEAVDINGWRTSLSNTASFYFTEHGASYAERTGRPNDVGIIGVAVFRERARPVEPSPRISRNDAWNGPAPMQHDGRARADRADVPSMAQREEAAASPPAASGGIAPNDAMKPKSLDSTSKDMASAPSASPSLGTGYGRSENSQATRVAFERATSTPVEVLSIRYDARDNLWAMGVLPRVVARSVARDPNPFPGSFVPPPN